MAEPHDAQTFGGMELLAKLSSGGMGDILLARRRGAHGFEKLIAVKTIRYDLARRDDMRKMFLDEARLMARLDHPAIAQVYDFGEENETLYLAMEYVPGMALNRILKRRPAPFPPRVAAQVIGEVCRGLHAAHELVALDGTPLGVVHRDVSPQNVMLTFDGRVKILDFGIAQRRDREAPETGVGVMKGKISYAAPEQIAGDRVDRRTDVYGASVVLYEIATGKRPFHPTVSEAADLEERKKVAPPSAVLPAIHPALETVIMRGLGFKPDDRYADAKEMAIALEHAASDIGGEALIEFAERELAEDRRLHRERLHQIARSTGEYPEPRAASNVGSAPPRAGSTTGGASQKPRAVATPTPLPPVHDEPVAVPVTAVVPPPPLPPPPTVDLAPPKPGSSASTSPLDVWAEPPSPQVSTPSEVSFSSLGADPSSPGRSVSVSVSVPVLEKRAHRSTRLLLILAALGGVVMLPRMLWDLGSAEPQPRTSRRGEVESAPQDPSAHRDAGVDRAVLAQRLVNEETGGEAVAAATEETPPIPPKTATAGPAAHEPEPSKDEALENATEEDVDVREGEGEKEELLDVDGLPDDTAPVPEETAHEPPAHETPAHETPPVATRTPSPAQKSPPRETGLTRIEAVKQSEARPTDRTRIALKPLEKPPERPIEKMLEKRPHEKTVARVTEKPKEKAPHASPASKKMPPIHAPSPSHASTPPHHPPEKKHKPTVYGLLAVEASPNAVVVIDGRTVGFTPLAHIKLPTGRHDVQLRRPYTRALRWRKIVTIYEGKKHSVSLK